MLKKWLEHPLTRGLEIDDPKTTETRRKIVREKAFLKKLYSEWYRTILRDVPQVCRGEKILELGSGAGFLKDVDERVITSEVFACEGVDLQVDACDVLPFGDGELKAILMTDVFHHLPDVDKFLDEATRALASNGVISMIEPWVTSWSKIVYTKLHHEPFDATVAEWRLSTRLSGGGGCPLSSANGALAWIVFHRDREIFARKYPQFEIVSIRPLMPFAYLFSGGISMRSLAPGWSYEFIRLCEKLLHPLDNKLAMFAHVVLRKIPV